MPAKPLSLVSLAAAACLSAALASCGSGSVELAGSGGGAVPGQEAAGWKRAFDNLNAAKSLAAETIVLAMVAPSPAAIERARAAADAHLEAAKAAVAAAEALRSAGGGNRQADARSALGAAQSDRAASRRLLNDLQEALGGSPGSGGSGPSGGAGPGGSSGPGGGTEPGGSPDSGGSAESRVRSLLADLGARTLTHLELGYKFRSSGSSTELTHVHPCSESNGACNIGGIRHDAERYFNPAFFPARSKTTRIASLSAAPANGVEAFSDMGGEGDGYGRLLAIGRHSAARLHLGGAHHYGVALGERHNGRPGDPSGGSATWRGQMVGRSMDGGSPLAGESALTYSFGTNTADVRISGIRAISDATYTGGTSFTWSGLAVNSDGSFYIPGYNNDRSEATLGTALHPTLGYIDGDFYGPNAEEAAGIFTRGGVNGAWVARSSGWRTSADDGTPSEDGTPSDGGQPPAGNGPTAQGGGAGSLPLAQRLANFRSRTLTSLERGHNYRNFRGSAGFYAIRCSESAGTCGLGGFQQGGNRYLTPAFFLADSATPFTAAPVNGVDAFSDHWNSRDNRRTRGEYHRRWKLLMLGQFSAARMDTNRVLDRTGTSLEDTNSYGVALGERHGRPSGASGSATWRGQMVGAAMDNGGPLAGESALTYSFSANTVDVRISNIRAVGDVAPYTGGTSFTWSGLAVNSDGSFHIPGYNNDRSGLTLGTALHPTLGYIDGDFYGPNAEEAAGIFTRGNVNGAWLAKK